MVGLNSYHFEGVVTALSSIFHGGGESYGINAKFRREKFVQPDGNVEEVPVVSGNAMRGMLRDVGMWHLCKKLGYHVDEKNGKIDGLTLPALHFLFSGGTLTSVGGQALDVGRARRLKELIPLIGIFGGAMGNQIMEGKTKIGKLIPICQETMHLLPKQYYENGNTTSMWSFLQEEMYVRRDDAKSEKFSRLLVSPEISQVSKAIEKDSPQQMMYYVETIAAGTKFYWEIVIDDVTDIEMEAFVITLAEFSRRPYIGGSSRVGHGKIKVNFDKWLILDPHVQSEKQQAVGLEIGKLYEKHVKENQQEIREMLDGIK